MNNRENALAEMSDNKLAGILCYWYSGACCRGCPMNGRYYVDCCGELARWLGAEHKEDNNAE